MDEGAQPTDADVLIIGAGLSGIGAACHLVERAPQKTYAVLEARERIGGTWDLFRYPGIRSDSDMFTLGYRFRPWKEAKAIADGPDIRRYIRETAEHYGVAEHIRFSHRAVRAEWSSEEARWKVTVERTDTGGKTELTCSFLYGCTGYYRYDEGYTPDLPATERFGGQIIHPQHWPSDLDYSGKRVVIIGSGATAVTLVPAMSWDAERVTMLQRSPSYIVSLPARDPIADVVRRLLPDRIAYPLVRWKNVLVTLGFFKLSRRFPEIVKRWIGKGVKGELPAGVSIDPHFKPRYDPWDQRVCLVPDADLFRSLRSGKAEIVTGEIETFTEAGIALRSGEELEADLVVTATGLNLQALGGIELAVDGRKVELPEAVGYKGMMLSGIPNMVLTLGYTNASWTLKADLVAEYVCRLLNHMDSEGYDVATPRAPPPSQELEKFIDLEAGYVRRSIDELPWQGTEEPWKLHQNYPRDVLMLRYGSLTDEGISFSRAGRTVEAEDGGREPEALITG